MVLSDRSRWTVREVALCKLASHRNRPFVSDFDGLTQTYGEFIGSGARIANALAELGIQRGATVAILCAARLPHLHAWLGCGLLGATEVPINPALRGEALRHVLRIAAPAVAVVEAHLLPCLAEAHHDVGCLRDIIVVGGEGHSAGPGERVIRITSYEGILASGSSAIPEASVVPAAIGSVMFTSGTTGPAKGVSMPNGQLCLMALQVIDAVKLEDSDIFYCAHPLNHIAGKYMGVFASFAAGGRIALDARFDATRWLDRIRESRATLSIAHGPMIEMIANQPPRPEDRCHSLHRLMCCPMPKHLAAGFEERFGVKGIEMWGMTEIGCPTWTPIDGPRVAGSCGRLISSQYELRIVTPDNDEEVPPNTTGEIVVRPCAPSTIMQGYLGMPEETVSAWKNLWFHTGDAGYVDGDGNLFFVDRLKERIRRRAENISAYDIEVAAASFPHVREAAAVGVPSGFEGDDDIKLCVVPDGSLDPGRLISFLARRLPPFMLPRYIELLEALPRTPTNKIRKRELSSAGVPAGTWDRNREGVKLRDLYRSSDEGEALTGNSCARTNTYR
jgi:crotonobetaine/carnitine-CoA ligase